MTSTISTPTLTSSTEKANEAISQSLQTKSEQERRQEGQKEKGQEGLNDKAASVPLPLELQEVRRLILSQLQAPHGADRELVQSLTNDMAELYRGMAKPLDALRGAFADFNRLRDASTNWDNLPAAILRLSLIGGRILQAQFTLRAKGEQLFASKTDTKEALKDQIALMQELHNQFADLVIGILEMCGSLKIPIGDVLASRALEHELAQLRSVYRGQS